MTAYQLILQRIATAYRQNKSITLSALELKIYIDESNTIRETLGKTANNIISQKITEITTSIINASNS